MLFAVDDQQHHARGNHGDAGPARNDGCLLFGDRELEWTDLALMRFLGVIEVAIEQSQNAANQEDDPEYFCAAHVSSSKSN